MAKVCNPIYDTVFKYLVEDERVAKVLLGGILNKKIESVEIKGHECAYQSDDNVLNFKTQCEFIKGMTYHLYIIQIPFLPEKPKKPLEKIFRAFDQRYRLEYDSKYLELTEDKDDDSGYNVIFRRLLYAASDEQLRGNLDLEDYAERLHRIREAEKEDLQDELKEKNQLLAAKDSQLTASIKMLSSFGASQTQIAAQLSIPIDEVYKVLSELK